MHKEERCTSIGGLQDRRLMKKITELSYTYKLKSEVAAGSPGFQVSRLPGRWVARSPCKGRRVASSSDCWVARLQAR